MATASEIISAMREAAPPGQRNLDHAALGELRSLTQALIAATPDADEECGRFLRLRHRRIAAPEAELVSVVTGQLLFKQQLIQTPDGSKLLLLSPQPAQ